MKFKNKDTGLVWKVTNEAHQKRLLSSTKFEQVESNNEDNTPTETPTEATQEADTEETEYTPDDTPDEQKEAPEQPDYTTMQWHDLRALAAEKGLQIHGVKRKELEADLQKIGDLYGH
ncbi:hypothetical protein [Salsuginibacillus kocurii]|uniref:hypothetical protein n=1 Tax=Salsuginibacillus kocurii TaxID=427078 RepID=UPI00036D41E7|nr:hypothetical protein [Salsuginibacillus kocurii]